MGLRGMGSGAVTDAVLGLAGGLAYAEKHGLNPWTGASLAKPFTVTPDGVVLPKDCEIPSNLIENPHKSGINSYGELIPEGSGYSYIEKIRIDQGTPTGYKGPERSHFHINNGKEHIFDINRWPYKR